jgi:hypothetical protein
MKSYKQPLILAAVLIIFLTSATAVFGEVGLGGGRTVLINAHGVCARVTNYNGPDFFIPTGNPTEWSYFRSNAPNKALAGINATSFTITYGTTAYADVNVQCGPSGKIGIRVQSVRAFNTCMDGMYTTTYDSWPAVVLSDGGCASGGLASPWHFPDFTFGTPATYSWKEESGNGCDAGCAMQGVSYDGNGTITFIGWQTRLTAYGAITVSWDAAGNPSIYVPPEPPDSPYDNSADD